MTGGTLRPIAAHARPVVDLFQDLGRPWHIAVDQLDSLCDALSRTRVPVQIHTDRLPLDTPPPLPRLLLDAVDKPTVKLRVHAAFRYGGVDLTDAHGTLVRTTGGLLRRDRATEATLTGELLRALPDAARLPAFLAGEAAHRFLTGLEARLPGWIIEADRDLFDRFGAQVELDLQLFERQDWYRLEARFHVDGEDVGLRQVLTAWRQRRRHLRLDDGRLAALPERWLAAHAEGLFQLAAAQAGCQGAPGRWAAPLFAQLLPEEDLPPPVSEVAARLQGFDAAPVRAIPAGLNATLRPYQRRGFEWLCTLRDLEIGGVLADDMGLGKTVQALAFLLAGRPDADAPDLVVAPTSVVPGWAEQAARFAPSLRVHVHHGTNRRPPEAPVDLVITSYPLLRLDRWLNSQRWGTAVFDEAQAFKNRRSQTAHKARTLDARTRFALTGTPLENHLDELWSIMRVVCPGLLGNHDDFTEAFVQPFVHGEDVLPALRARLAPFMLRRLKGDVATDLPSRDVITVPLPLTDAHRKLYDRVRDAVRVELADPKAHQAAHALRQRLDAEVGGAPLHPLEALIRLRQAASVPAALDLPAAKAVGRSTKRRWIARQVPELVLAGHKVLVFSQWTRVLRTLRADLERLGLRTLYLDGQTKERATLQARFNAPEGPPVFLISTMAGGTGLTLTGADHVVLHEPWWNPAVEQQAADRAHRIGQTRPVTVWRLIADDTVEEEMQARQQDKQLLFASTVESLPTSSGLSPASVQAVLQRSLG